MLVQNLILRNCCNNIRFKLPRVTNHRFLSTESSNKSAPGSQDSTKSSSVVGATPYKPTDFEKWILVWTKKYPKGKVPDLLDGMEVYRAKSKARIKFANYLIGFSVLASIGAIISGKNARSRGESLMQVAIKKRDEAENSKKSGTQ